MPINDKSRFAYNHLISRGLTPVQAAGIVGNLQAESNFDTTVVGKADNMGSIGIAQWHSERKQGLLDFAKKRGERYDNLTTQLDYVVEELNSPAYAKAMQGLNSAKNPQEAAIAFMNHYEKPAEWAKKQSVGQRVGVANSILSGTPYENVDYISEQAPTLDISYLTQNYDALSPQQRAEFDAFMNTRSSSEDTESPDDAEAVQAKNELAQKENEKNFLDELNSQYQEAQQQEQAPQQQAPVDNSVYSMPQIELPQYQAPQMPEYQTGGGFWNTYVDPVISTVTEFFTGEDDEEEKIAKNKKILDTKPTDFASMEKKYDYINKKKSDTLNQNDYIKNNSQRLLLTKGRYRNASINPNIVDEAYKTAKEKNIDPFELLAIIGRESVFGKGYSSREGKQVGKFVETSKKAMASAWNTSEDYRPESPLKFLADKDVPGVKSFSNNQGWYFSIKDEAAMKKHLAEHPRLLEQYDNKLKDTKNIKGADSFDMAVDFIKEKGLKNYNPNDPNYQRMVMEDYKVLRSDPVLMNYINKKYNLKDYSKAIYQDGGEWFNETVREREPGMMEETYDDYNTAMTGMMKSKIGMGNAFQNPSVVRMSQAMPKTGMTPEGMGTHYMSSTGNYARPLLQDTGEEQLQYFENPGASSEDIVFSSPEEADYFARNYKQVAPMTNTYQGLQEYKEGGALNQYQKAGIVYVESEKDPGYVAYQDSLSSYKRGRKAFDLLKKTTVGKKNLDSYDVEVSKEFLDNTYTEKEKKKLYNKNNYKNLEYFKKAVNPDGTRDEYWKPLQAGFDAVNENVKTSKVLPYAALSIVGENNGNQFPVWKKPERQVIVQRPKLQSIQTNLKPQGLVNLNIETPISTIRPEAVSPNSYNVNYSGMRMDGSQPYYANNLQNADEQTALRAMQQADAQNAYWQNKYGNSTNPKAIERVNTLRDNVTITPQYKEGGIPDRYKNAGFTKVGAKKQSTRPGKKWMVLARKGDQYKIVHGGYDGMKDFSQHGSKDRKERFWDRMGGRDSAKANDPFSPLYWHKRFGTWAEGGEVDLPEYQNAGFSAESKKPFTAPIVYNNKPSTYTTKRDSVAHQADKILEYEQLRGGPGGAPLDGTNGNPDYSDPVYRKVLMNSIYPQVQKIMPKASAMEIGEAMDFVFNAGWDKDNNKITKDPRAFALQEYYKQYDPSKLDKDGTWGGRKNAPYSFDQEYNNTIGKLPENQRRILMNRGRDWYYQNTAPKGSTWDLKTQGPHPNYSSTWYGRIHNTNDYKPFNPNNPKFTKKEMGGYYQKGGKQNPITTREDFDPGILSNIPGLTSFASGNQPGYNRYEQYGPLGDLYRYYGGQPLEHGVLVESQNKPSTSKDKNAKYISLNHDREFVNEVLDNYERVLSGKLDKGESKLGNDSWQVNGYSSAGKDAHKTIKQGSEHHSNAIGRYILGKGEDEKGEYISYYDKFDQGTGSGMNPGEALGLTKPFEIYDRIYLKDVNRKFKNGGELIKRADGSYSRRGLWDNIRANKGSGKKPTKQMLEQERKIKAKYENGGYLTQNEQIPLSELKRIYSNNELIDMLTHMSNGGSYGLPMYQEGGAKEANPVKIVTLQDADGTMRKVRTDSQEYADLYKSGNLQSGDISENADRETWFGGELDQVNVVGKKKTVLTPAGVVTSIGNPISLRNNIVTRDNISSMQLKLKDEANDRLVEKSTIPTFIQDKVTPSSEEKIIKVPYKEKKEEYVVVRDAISKFEPKIEKQLRDKKTMASINSQVNQKMKELKEIDPDIHKAVKMSEVMTLQKKLYDLGYDLGDYGKNKDGIDGKFGKMTKKALEEFEITGSSPKSNLSLEQEERIARLRKPEQKGFLTRTTEYLDDKQQQLINSAKGTASEYLPYNLQYNPKLDTVGPSNETEGSYKYLLDNKSLSDIRKEKNISFLQITQNKGEWNKVLPLQLKDRIVNSTNPQGYAPDTTVDEEGKTQFTFFDRLASEKSKNKQVKRLPGVKGNRREDIYRMYSGLPQKYDTFTASSFKAGNNSDTNVTFKNPEDVADYIKIAATHTNLFKRLANGEITPETIAKDKTSGKKGGEKINKAGFRDPKNVMWNATFGIDFDKKGNPYLSFYDNWDLKGKDDLAVAESAFGSPIEIYDRIPLTPGLIKQMANLKYKADDSGASDVVPTDDKSLEKLTRQIAESPDMQKEYAKILEQIKQRYK